MFLSTYQRFFDLRLLSLSDSSELLLLLQELLLLLLEELLLSLDESLSSDVEDSSESESDSSLLLSMLLSLKAKISLRTLPKENIHAN